MSNIVKARATAVTSYDEELAAEAAKMRERIGAPSGDVIRVNRDKTFSLPNGDKNDELSLVIVAFNTLHQYYPGKYDPKNIQPPVCVALGSEIKLMKPIESSPNKQAESCAVCPQNQWGSDGKGKACKNARQMIVVPPSVQADGPLLLLRTSPTAVRYFDSYVADVTAKFGGLIKVVTRVYFSAEDFPSLRFEVSGPNDAWQDAFPRRVKAAERLAIEPELSPKVAVKQAA